LSAISKGTQKLEKQVTLAVLW